MTFSRDKYYSQSEILKQYKITAKALQALHLPHIDREADLGTYKVTSHYYLKELIHSLNLPKRK